MDTLDVGRFRSFVWKIAAAIRTTTHGIHGSELWGNVLAVGTGAAALKSGRESQSAAGIGRTETRVVVAPNPERGRTGAEGRQLTRRILRGVAVQGGVRVGDEIPSTSQDALRRDPYERLAEGAGLRLQVE